MSKWGQDKTCQSKPNHKTPKHPLPRSPNRIPFTVAKSNTPILKELVLRFAFCYTAIVDNLFACNDRIYFNLTLTLVQHLTHQDKNKSDPLLECLSPEISILTCYLCPAQCWQYLSTVSSVFDTNTGYAATATPTASLTSTKYIHLANFIDFIDFIDFLSKLLNLNQINH